MNSYPDNWQEIATRVKDDADWTCIRCDHEHDPASGYCLTVHHLDGDKSNCKWWNLTALCQRCHLQIQAKVEMSRIWMFEHSEWFKPYVAGYYMGVNGHFVSKEYARKNADEIITAIRDDAAGAIDNPAHKPQPPNPTHTPKRRDRPLSEA